MPQPVLPTSASTTISPLRSQVCLFRDAPELRAVPATLMSSAQAGRRQCWESRRGGRSHRTGTGIRVGGGDAASGRCRSGERTSRLCPDFHPHPPRPPLSRLSRLAPSPPPVQKVQTCPGPDRTARMWSLAELNAGPTQTPPHVSPRRLGRGGGRQAGRARRPRRAEGGRVMWNVTDECATLVRNGDTLTTVIIKLQAGKWSSIKERYGYFLLVSND